MAVGISSTESSPLVAHEMATAGAGAAPLTVPDDGLYELVDGRIVEKNVGAQQVEIAFDLAHAIASFAKPAHWDGR